jgi:3'(2'), 5'-bisphosphate nucleotidase
MQLRDLAFNIIKIAEKAGAEILNIYNNNVDQKIELKADRSPLTIADRNANNIINEGLKSLDIQFPIISEENENVDFEVRKNYEHYWLVDPLDGTKEFIKRNGEFTVNIALIHSGKAILGVVYAPYLNEMFWAGEGEGAFLILNGNSKKLNTQEFGFKDFGLNIVCSRSHLNDETQKFVGKFDHPNLVPKGSSLKFTIIAKGDAHLYPRLAPTMEWDTAAAQIVLEEAGGKVLNAETNLPLRYNKKELLNPHFIAYGKVNL